MSRLTLRTEHPDDLTDAEKAAVEELEKLGIHKDAKGIRVKFNGGEDTKFYLIMGFDYKDRNDRKEYCVLLAETDQGGAAVLGIKEEAWPVDYVAEMLTGRNAVGGTLKKLNSDLFKT